MVTEQTLKVARTAAAELRRRGDIEGARAIDALVEVAVRETLPTLDLLTTTQAGDLLGVTGQTIKNWVRRRQLPGYRVGGRIMIPKEAVTEYVRRARRSLQLEEISDAEAARLVAEGRRRHA